MPTKIDLKLRTADTPLYARILWEKLFRLVHGEGFKDLDSFLCDLRGFENQFARFQYNVGSAEKVHTFYWKWDQSGYTEISSNQSELGHGSIFQIDYVRNTSITITPYDEILQLEELKSSHYSEEYIQSEIGPAIGVFKKYMSRQTVVIVGQGVYYPIADYERWLNGQDHFD